MDKFREGIKHYFKVGEKLTPLNFDAFIKRWLSSDSSFVGYRQSNFDMYLEISKHDEGSDLFVFSLSGGLENYIFNREGRTVSKMDLVDEKIYPLVFEDFYDKNRTIFSKGFTLSPKDESYLSEKIALALCDMGLHHRQNEYEYAASRHYGLHMRNFSILVEV